MAGEDLSSLSDAGIAALVEDIRRSGDNINLGVPYRPETVATFHKMFTCQRCGACCRGEGLTARSGVALAPAEVEAFADALNIPRSRFKQDYTCVKDGRRILKYPCPLNAEGSRHCRIYASRPGVCRAFPLHAPLAGPDGTYLLVVASLCPEGRRVAVEFLKMRRDILKSLQGMSQTEQDKLKEASQTFWETSKREQKVSGWFKEKPE